MAFTSAVHDGGGLALCWRLLGAYMVAVYQGRAKWLNWLEQPVPGVEG